MSILLKLKVVESWERYQICLPKGPEELEKLLYIEIQIKR